MYTGRGEWAKKDCNDCNCNEGDSEREESTEEQLQCKKAVFMHSSWDTVSCFSLPVHHRIYAPKRVMRYAISDFTNPQSYCGEERGSDGDFRGLGCVESPGGGKDGEKRDQWC